MILIADSGSTKTAWKLIGKEKNTDEIAVFYTSGINPFYQSSEEIAGTLSPLKLYSHTPLPCGEGLGEGFDVFFYGAGCHFPDKKEIVKSALQQIFPAAEIEINNDLLAACRALFQHEAGIACILGTGSNSCFYNGEKIVENVSPLGYILGDEGSGAVLGKLLVADILKNQLPENLKNKFLLQYHTSLADILDNVYKKPFPNRYLAKFSHFIGENLQEETLYNIVYRSFRSFFERNVMQYDYHNYPISFTGSIAFYFKEMLQEVAGDLGLNISKIEQSPMEGLCEFHI